MADSSINPVEVDFELTELKKLTKWVKDNYGYDFTSYAMSSFRRRVQRSLQIRKAKNIDELISQLGDKKVFEDFLSHITVNVTEMFRDPSFWVGLKEEIIPHLIKKHRKLNIWHAGCSSGEEVCSMVILLKELGVLNKASITATDLDNVILDRAKESSFSNKNMELNGKNLSTVFDTSNIQDYGSTVANNFNFDSSLLKDVNFLTHDLVLDEPLSGFNLILCRNVMIYFNQPLQNSVLAKLHSSLNMSGYLGIGSKESIGWGPTSNKFRIANKEEKIYQKVKD